MDSMDKIALITGVSSGIGQATAKLFSKEDWFVIGVSRSNIQQNNDLNLYIRGDIAKINDIEKIFSEIIRNVEQIDVLVNNAAIQICKPLIEMSIKEWDLIFNTNVRSTFLCSKNAHPLLSKNSGAIVNVSSVHAVATSNNIAAYAASKGALMALTRAMALEFAKDNIRVNAVLPGAVDTSMLRAGINREHVSGNTINQGIYHLAKRHPLGNIGKPEEIAQAILFLADGNRSSFITGHGLIVDGGATIKLSTE